MSAVHGTNNGEIQAAKSIRNIRYINCHMGSVTCGKTLEAYKTISRHIYQSEKGKTTITKYKSLY
jgi:hypothetical protein